MSKSEELNYTGSIQFDMEYGGMSSSTGENVSDSENTENTESITEDTSNDTVDTDNNGKKHNKKGKNKKRLVVDMKKITMIILIVVVVFVLLASVVSDCAFDETDHTYPELLEMIEQGQIEEVDVYTSGNTITAHLKDGEKIVVPNPRHDEVRKELMMTGVKVNIGTMTAYDAVQSMILQIPIYALLALFIYYLASSMSTMTKTYMRTATMEDGIKFDQVAGMSEVKMELQFVIDFLRQPKKYRDSGARVPKGLLMVGPPGTGKTLLAKAVAGEANVPFIHTTGSDFSEMFAGLGAKRVRELFEFARTNAPCVIFIDEIDSLGAIRTNDGSAVSRDNNQTLNALLKEMDGIGTVQGIFVMAATNTPQHLDPALVRPGRFDRQIRVGPPTNKEDRVAIIDVHLNGKLVEEGITPETISKKMVGFTGAQIEVTLNEAVIQSLMKGREGVISMDDIDAAIEKMITKGVRGKVVRNNQLKRVAVHESGHALLNLLYNRKVEKVTIVPTTSGVGGFTMQNMEQFEEETMRTEESLREDIKILYGGLAAEEILLGSHSIGCSNDIQQASQLCVDMLTKYAMLGASIDTSIIDKSKLVERAEKVAQVLREEAKNDLYENVRLLETLANRLHEEETMSLNSIEDI